MHSVLTQKATTRTFNFILKHVILASSFNECMMEDGYHPSGFYIPKPPRGLPVTGRIYIVQRRILLCSYQYDIRIILIFLPHLKTNS